MFHKSNYYNKLITHNITLGIQIGSSCHIPSAAKKVRKVGIGSALRTFLIFGSAFGPHWREKVGIFASRDKES